MFNDYNPLFLDRTNLVWEWLLNGNALDTSWNWNNGTATNVTYVWADRWYVSNVGSFNGISSQIDTWTKLVSWLTNVTVSTWINVNSFSNDGQCYIWEYNISWDRALAMDTVNSSNFRFIVWDSSNNVAVLTTTLGYSTWTWYHLVFTYNNWDIKWYINWNEVLSDTTTLSWALDTCTENFFIWCRKSWTEYFDGKIWLVRVYEETLSLDKINNLYQEWLREFWPTNAELSLWFPKHSTLDLERWKVLEISRSANGWIYYNQTWNWNNWIPTNVTDSTLWLNNVMSFNGGSSSIDLPVLTISDFTFSAIVKFNVLSWITNNIYSNVTTTPNTRIIEIRTNWNKLQFWINDWTFYWLDSITSLSTWVYYRIHCSYNSITWVKKIYINWIEDNSETITTWLSFDATFTDWHTIWNYIKNFRFLNWDIIEPILYNRVLSPEEAQEDFYSNFIS